MSNKILVSVLVLIVVIAGGYLLLQGEKVQAPTDEALTPATSSAVEQNTIIYNETGYTPASLVVKIGDTVVFKNESAKNMWPASAMHPSHSVYSGTTLSEHCPDLENSTFDACQGIAPGQSWSFMFNKAGEWKYHDHLSPNFFGGIIVE